MGWKLKVSGYGKIESAEIDTAPLTLFVGDNNSGKSYLMSLLWGIRNLGADLLFRRESESATEAEERLQCWINEQVRAAREQGGHTVCASEIGDDLQIALQERIDQNKEKFVKAIFNSSDIELKKFRIELTELADLSLVFRLEKFGEEVHVALPGNGDNKMYLRLTEKEKMTGILEEDNCRFFVNVLFAMVLKNYNAVLNSGIYFPAARTGFMLTKDIINKAGRKAAFNVMPEQEAFTPFVKPVNQFLDVINDLTLDRKGSENFAEVVRYLENGIADGIVEMSTLPNKEVMYVPNGRTAGMSLRTVSAVVTELSPLILILKHKEFVETLYYEEPEMCLHPQLQQKMARVLCQLVNAGVQMNVTTHSDIILQHINNMIRLSGRKDREELCRQFGYTAADLLHPDQVKVYQLTAEAGAKTKVKKLSCGENGFEVPTFNDALDQMMEEAYAIQE